MKKYEKLDNEIFHICRNGEKKCKGNRNGSHKWSPKLSLAIKTVTYWQARKKYEGKNRLIEKLGKEINLTFEYKTEEEIRTNLNNSRAELAKVQQDSVKYRKEYLEARANKYANENNMSKANAINEIISHESVRMTFAILREKVKRKHMGQIQQIWIVHNNKGNYTKDPQNKTEITLEEEIHTKPLDWNKKHLGRARKTPFARGRLAKKLNWDFPKRYNCILKVSVLIEWQVHYKN